MAQFGRRCCLVVGLLIAGRLLAQDSDRKDSAAHEKEADALVFTGSPLTIPYVCSDDDLQWAGLSCSEDACPIYAELSHAAGKGNTILITGDFHAPNATMYSLLLRTEDGGLSWREPVARMRGAVLDGVEMYDAQNAWVSGGVQQPLALDPFFLVTADGGKNWVKVPLFDEEGTPGGIVQFHFDSREHGMALVDRGGGEMRYEVYETQSAGRAWSMQRQTDKMPKVMWAPEGEWRMHPEPKLFRLQHLEEGRWNPFASFAVAAGQCREQPRGEPKEPARETPEAAQPAAGDAAQEIQLNSGAPAKKKKPKP